MVYCDSNLLVRFYAELPDSQHALEQLHRSRRRGAKPIPITWLHQVEVANAFEQLVFFGRTGGAGPMRMTTEQAVLASSEFDEDLADGNGFVGKTLIANDVIRVARQLLHRHTAKHGFRTYDIIHVASALILECDAFWSFDAKATKLARLEGLQTL